MMLKNKKGITLISLIITIIILIILTGIVINLSIGNEGLFKKASLSKEQYTIESIREKLEIKKAIPYIEKEGNITVDEYLQYLETEKIEPYKISKTQKVADDTVVIEIDNKYSYVVKMSGDTKVEYEGKIDEIVREENNLAIEISGSTTQSSIPIKLTLNITNSMKGKWILDTNSDYIGTDEDLYTNEIQSGKNVEIVMNEVKEYYIHVISISKYGGKEETIKGPIIIEKKYHKHTGSSTSGGGCYGNGTHTHRGCTQAANWGKRDPSTGRCNQCAREISGGSWTDCPYCAGGYYYTCGNKPINTYSINCGKSTTTLEGYSVSY